MTEKKGLVKFISPKTFGVILESDNKVWYNPAKGTVVDLALKGQRVIMDMIDQKTFSHIEADRSKPAAAPQMDRHEQIIVRESAIKSAAQMANTPKELFEISEAIEQWITRE